MRQRTIHAIAFFFILVTMASMFSLYLPKSFAQEEDVVVIPNEAIRLRILANSNSEQDQRIKRIVRDRVNAQITEWVSELTSMEAAREKIITNLDILEATAKEVLEENGVNQKVQIRFGEVDFPTKLYGNFLYPAGKYEAVLITLGEGTGANWWCVLFPPLCFLDFSSGTAVSDGFEDKGKNVSDDTKIDLTTHKEKKNDVTAKSNSDDQSNEQLYVEENEEDVEVKFFLVEFIENIFDLFK
ncbi:MAG: stage II sporulation protein R [Caldibacillus thermoamylovorans]|uniref:stage II sporulation protein R n=1 Tax=Caldibacillus TaxID=1276290 RepID=UPI001D066128|nr:MULTISPECIES: stage II sporulation protein R [Caldibacillus]MCB5935164.1 stage II sporulation protein R [Bacillus sp. DFI.2.34]MCB7069037.1 stage II sporulation protein R [Caldibacillus sp. 210928-DFI.2.22]MCB7072343.1 stage II sporulation protein R [Caldibacillus sp. 210928-DFI.2.18]MCB7076216.1 stage II sporulation protein R [Caldibacillus thermoamylovorans]